MYTCLWLIHTVVQKELTQHCKAVILQFKNKSLESDPKLLVQGVQV